MDYIEFTIKTENIDSEILIAVLADVGFDSFQPNDTETELIAWVSQDLFNLETIQETLKRFVKEADYSHKKIEDQNWNKSWEENYFNPVKIKDEIIIRASFHEKQKGFKHEIIIDPKMSFGTGNHATTSLVLQLMLDVDFSGKKVLDMGCGTSVLAIYAEMKGSADIDAIDNDEWAYNNSVENVRLNNCEKIKVYHGDASLITDKKYDIVLANITRNILLNDMQSYVNSLIPSGQLLLSGFLENDLDIIIAKCESLGMKFVKNIKLDKWIGAYFVKN